MCTTMYGALYSALVVWQEAFELQVLIFRFFGELFRHAFRIIRESIAGRPRSVFPEHRYRRSRSLVVPLAGAQHFNVFLQAATWPAATAADGDRYLMLARSQDLK